MKRMYVGFASTFHDSAIAIVNDQGEIVFAEATERYMQNKRAINIRPDLFCRTGELLKEYCSSADEIVPAFSWSGQRREQIHSLVKTLEDGVAQARSFYGTLPDFIRRETQLLSFMLHSEITKVHRPGFGLEYELGQIDGPTSRLQPARHFDHHLTHAATASLTSPFGDAVCAVVDGHGETKAYECYRYTDGKLSVISAPTTNASASLGLFFTEVCELCGFGSLKGEEWKVMGLAAYGEMDEEIYSTLKKMIRADGITLVEPNRIVLGQLRFKLEKIRRRDDEPAISARNIAYAGQKVFAETLGIFLTNLHDQTGADNLVLTGGCALNSSANGRVLADTPFKNLFVFPSPGDDGNAVGAALLAYQEDHPDYRPSRAFQSPYLGSKMSAEGLEHLRSFGPREKMTECGGNAPERAAELLAQGKIIGWIQGQAEYGPRALGNRSILADPRSAAVKEQINARVKFREEFRPFAPAILHEHGAEYFVDYHESPYMERTLKFRPEMVQSVPGVVHEDGTGRLQTVKREWNERFYRLVRRFYEITRVPIVLNTSFNVMGKPIAHSVEDVIAVFYTSGLDAVFIGDLLIEK